MPAAPRRCHGASLYERPADGGRTEARHRTRAPSFCEIARGKGRPRQERRAGPASGTNAAPRWFVATRVPLLRSPARHGWTSMRGDRLRRALHAPSRWPQRILDRPSLLAAAASFLGLGGRALRRCRVAVRRSCACIRGALWCRLSRWASHSGGSCVRARFRHCYPRREGRSGRCFLPRWRALVAHVSPCS